VLGQRSGFPESPSGTTPPFPKSFKTIDRLGCYIAAMPHSLVCNWQHVVFSTKERRPCLKSDLQKKLWPYLGGIADHHGMRATAIGGVEDHVHILVAIPGPLAVSTAVQKLKANSSRWVRQSLPHFSWQEGFAAFSVSASNLQAVTSYIEGQQEHHRKRTFQEELVSMLKKHDVQYDHRYILG
jgi:putative transposase